MPLTNYISFFADIKVRIREAQTKATLAANAQMIALYWDIGKIILEKQKQEGWGSNIIKRLSVDLKSDLPKTRGFSSRNIEYMLRFAKEYSIVQQSVAELEQTVNQTDIVLQQAVAKLDYLNTKNSCNS
jgi:predicted nuclease of restriction endonuclease-like (RecB) superfamily